MRNLTLQTAKLFSLAVFCVFMAPGCAVFDTRPARQMAYAEAAYQAAVQANAEANPTTLPIFQLGKDQLSRARSMYRLKNFKEARRLSVVSRRLLEEAEWKAVRANSSSNDVQSLVK